MKEISYFAIDALLLKSKQTVFKTLKLIRSALSRIFQKLLATERSELGINKQISSFQSFC